MERYEIDERELPRLIREEPEKGMTLAIRLYGNPVRTICRNILAGCGSAEAEDAVAECFVNVWQAAGRFNPSQGTSFRSYCYGIARTTALARRRKLRAEPVLPLEETIFLEDSEDVFSRQEEEGLIHEAVEMMKEPDRTIFLLRYFYFFKVKEIAERLELPPKKVENILFRRKKDLEAILLEGGIGCEEIG